MLWERIDPQAFWNIWERKGNTEPELQTILFCILIKEPISSQFAGNFAMPESCGDLNQCRPPPSISAVLSNDLHPLKFREEIYIKPVSIYEGYKKELCSSWHGKRLRYLTSKDCRKERERSNARRKSGNNPEVTISDFQKEELWEEK